jgi:hypothetical protein
MEVAVGPVLHAGDEGTCAYLADNGNPSIRPKRPNDARAGVTYIVSETSVLALLRS